MKLITDYKDYYDSAITQFYSDEPIFRRLKSKTIDLEKIPFEVKEMIGHKAYARYGHKYVAIIYFCGVKYVAIHGRYFDNIDFETVDYSKPLNKKTKLRSLKNQKYDRWFYYNKPQDLAIISEIENTDRIRMLLSIGTRISFARIASGTQVEKRSTNSVNFMGTKTKEALAKSLDKYIEELREPVVVVKLLGNTEGIHEISLNTPLSNYEFAKAVDPYTAGSMLDNWFCNYVEPEPKETLDVSEKVKVQQHGMNKYSFRKCKKK